MKKIIAKFNSKCHATGKPIKKGEEIYFDTYTKKVYKLGAQPTEQAAGMVQANEEAYFDNFCQQNNI